jgi:hypothetical protein
MADDPLDDAIRAFAVADEQLHAAHRALTEAIAAQEKAAVQAGQLHLVADLLRQMMRWSLPPNVDLRLEGLTPEQMPVYRRAFRFVVDVAGHWWPPCARAVAAQRDPSRGRVAGGRSS